MTSFFSNAISEFSTSIFSFLELNWKLLEQKDLSLSLSLLHFVFLTQFLIQDYDPLNYLPINFFFLSFFHLNWKISNFDRPFSQKYDHIYFPRGYKLKLYNFHRKPDANRAQIWSRRIVMNWLSNRETYRGISSFHVKHTMLRAHASSRMRSRIRYYASEKRSQTSSFDQRLWTRAHRCLFRVTGRRYSPPSPLSNSRYWYTR